MWSRVFSQVEEEEVLVSVDELEKPVTADVVPVIIFFHGGSFAHSSASTVTYDIMCHCLVNIFKVVVVSINYQLALENQYP